MNFIDQVVVGNYERGVDFQILIWWLLILELLFFVKVNYFD